MDNNGNSDDLSYDDLFNSSDTDLSAELAHQIILFNEAKIQRVEPISYDEMEAGPSTDSAKSYTDLQPVPWTDGQTEASNSGKIFLEKLYSSAPINEEEAKRMKSLEPSGVIVRNGPKIKFKVLRRMAKELGVRYYKQYRKYELLYEVAAYMGLTCRKEEIEPDRSYLLIITYY